MESDSRLRAQSQVLEEQYTHHALESASHLAAMLRERAPSARRRRKENKLLDIVSGANAVSAKRLRVGHETVQQTLERADAAEEDDEDVSDDEASVRAGKDVACSS